MLDDLKALSKEFILENRNNRGSNHKGEWAIDMTGSHDSDVPPEVRYEESQTRIRRDMPEFEYDSRDRGPYGSPSTSSAYTISGTYSSDQNMTGYPPMYPPTSYGQQHAYSMSSNAGPVPAYSDPRYPSEYSTYPQGSRELPPSNYYPAPAGYGEPSRSRPDMPPNFYQTTGPPPPRSLMDDPSRYSYDSMQGVQASNPPPFPPHRGQNPSPYDPVPRESFARPPPEQFTGRRR
jgi:hypothetical protein